MTVYLTGDTHGHFERVARFCKAYDLDEDDIVIILGDAGVNYYGEGSARDRAARELLAGLAPSFFCIHGNHEMRPQSISSYHEADWRGGRVFVEDDYPNILFAKDGELFDFDGVKAFVAGGAYSIDKRSRLAAGLRWFPDEQPDEAVKRRVERALDRIGWHVDVMLTHTCPYSLEPREVFVAGVDQSGVDTSTEEWLDAIEARLDYQKWYCGHFHTSKRDGRLRIMFEDWDLLWPKSADFPPESYGAARASDRRSPAQLACDLGTSEAELRAGLPEDGLAQDSYGNEVCREIRVGPFVGRRYWTGWEGRPDDFPFGQCESCRRWFRKERLRIADVPGAPEEDQPLICPDCKNGIAWGL